MKQYIRRYKEKDNNLKETEKNVEDGKEIDKDKINEKNMDEDGIVLEEGIEDDENQKRNKDEEDDDNDNEGEIKEDADKITEVSFKTTSSQKRYIEELEQLLRDERMRRIKAEGELERLSTRHGKKHQQLDLKFNLSLFISIKKNSGYTSHFLDK